MLHRVLLSMSLVVGLATAACVEPAPSDEPTTDQVELDTAVDLAEPGAASDVVADPQPVNGPSAVCSLSYCANLPLQAPCSCYLGSGLWKESTCARRCGEVTD